MRGLFLQRGMMLAGGVRRGLDSKSRFAIIASILIASFSVVGSEGGGGDAKRKFIAPGKGRQEHRISQVGGGGGSNRGRARGTIVGKEPLKSLHNTAPRYYHDGPWAERQSSEVDDEDLSVARGPGMSSSRLRLGSGNDGAPGQLGDSKRRMIEGARKSSKQVGRLAIQERDQNMQADETMIARRGRSGLTRKKSEREESSSSYETMSWSAHSQEDQSYHSDGETDDDHDNDHFHDSDDDHDDDHDDDDDNGSETGGGASSEDESPEGGSQDSGSSIQESSSLESRLRRVEQRRPSGRGARREDNSAPRRRASVWHGKLTSEDERARGRGGGGGGGGRRTRESPGSESSTGGGELLGSSSDDFGEGVGTSAMVVDARRRQRQRQRKGR